MESPLARCKIVVVGDSQCGKTALLHVFAKDAYPESYAPTVFENYTASFEIEKQRIELTMWDTSGIRHFSSCCTYIMTSFFIPSMHLKKRPEFLESLCHDNKNSYS